MSANRPRRKRRKPSGFTLIELIVATAISSVVLVGMFSIATNLVSAEIDGMRSGTVTGFTMAAIGGMNADIGAAGAIGYPGQNVWSDFLEVCTNWSTRPAVPAAVDNGVGNTVTTYCYDSADPPPFGNAILRSVVPHGVGAAACPTAAPPACTSANYSIVATGVYRDPVSNGPLFYSDPKTLNALRLRFVVGNPVAGVSAGSNGQTPTKVPVSVAFNTEIILED